MKKIMFFVAATLALAAVGCSKNDNAPEEVKYVSELKLVFEGDTRIGYTHDPSSGLSFEWEEGDMIKVYEEDAVDYDFKQLSYNASLGSFVPLDESDKLEVGKKYIAMSKTLGSKTADGLLWGKLSNTNTTFDDLPMITDVFTATDETTIATMHHILGVIEIPVKAAAEGTTLNLIEVNLYGSSNKISGDYTVTVAAPYTIIPVGGYNNMSIKNLSKPLSTSTATSVFIPVFPCSDETIQIDYETTTNANGFISAITSHTLTVERGKITKISEQVLQ